MSRRPALLMLPALLVIAGLGVAPLVVIVGWSFWTWDPATYWIRPDLSFAAYEQILEAGRWRVLLLTLGKAALAGGCCLLIGYPVAYVMHFLAGRRLSLLLLALFTIPFFTSYLIRAFSWRLVLGRTGLINELLMDLGLIRTPIEWLLFSDFAVVVGLVASYLPFVVFPILLAMRRVDPSILRASQDLGAGFWQTFRLVLLPLTRAGVFAGFLFVFVMAAGSSTEVQMLGGAAASMISIMINDVMRVVNFPLAFAISAVVLAVLLALVILGNRRVRLARLFGEGSW